MPRVMATIQTAFHPRTWLTMRVNQFRVARWPMTYGNPLGNTNEAMLKAALAYRANPGTCPALPASRTTEPLFGYEGFNRRLLVWYLNLGSLVA